ncbi:MAG: ABC-F family ATP-binding cassette domain-containing protein [Balneola sp.]|nr:ABC-F family ATP-binding cassette domain-containing protein [Balneola sp.]MBO6651073.1 ABC-F family ATP-binding cassette domain-containing protein [Balneola sp.]MBO6712799.1 ABC-F family ATP-binding cassette domain-containing protein [Balneola sp.]MBO6801098.1 ABC-F family ATP-binding cassette domain-containing protein [Balneola sp.]MBO6871290.1 ABC-F family ATP-binding cassette domain-containing protein [Balneola sp.]
MLQLEKISLALGDRDLLDEISTLINPGERIGLVGPNGAGKSTLLKIIMGIQEKDAGSIVLSNEETLGYLPQDGVDPDFELTVIEEVETAFSEIFDLEEEVNELQQKLAETDPESEEHEKLLERYGLLQTKLEASGLYTLRSDVEKILMGLGFKESDFSRNTTEFSGGWLMRIALAKLLLKKPTYLLLDEPTNHLDIESLQWMENFLNSYEGAVIVVSHDRAFLDTITNRTLALRKGKMNDYSGNYSFYERKWEEERELLINAQKNQAKELKETEEFIERFRYKASKARQVQSRVKQLEKIDRIEVEDELANVSFSFPEPERSGQVVMRLENIKKSYGDNVVFDGLDYEIERGDKIAVVGPNGAGKSTMIRILAGIESIQGGERNEGHKVTTNYFAQHQAEDLDLKKDALEVMMSAGSNEKESRLRSILGSFLFRGDDVFKKVKVLSGGEKSRLALAKMLLSPANFLIFDEPTNHLDMSSKNILQQALQQYEGTCVIVSHDRAFLDPIVDKVLEVQTNRVRTYLGNVSYFLDKKKEEAEAQKNSGASEQSKSTSSDDGSLSRKEQRRIEAERRNKISKEVNPIKKKLEKVEKEIEQAESRKNEIEALMAEVDFYDDADRVKKTTLEYEQLKMDLTNHYSKWEEYANRIEAIEQELV